MAYFNDSDNFYSASAAPEEFDSYPFLQCQTSVTTDSAYRREAHTFAGSWATVDRLGLPTTTPTNLGATTSYVPTNLWVDQQRGAPSYGSYMDNPPDHHQSGPSAARIGTTDRRRFVPYDTYHDRTSMCGNTEAGPSNQASPPFPDGDWPTTQPTGGTSETTADAEQNRTITEDDETPAPRTRRARGKGDPRPYRERNSKDVEKLRTWVKALQRSQELPSHRDAIATATEIISVFRQPVYDEDRLFRVHGHRTGEGSKRANWEHERRNGTRHVYQKLSRLYRLEDRAKWTMTQLLSRVLEDLDAIDCCLRDVAPA